MRRFLQLTIENFIRLVVREPDNAIQMTLNKIQCAATRKGTEGGVFYEFVLKIDFSPKSSKYHSVYSTQAASGKLQITNIQIEIDL